jgi:hypothetical protein
LSVENNFPAWVGRAFPEIWSSYICMWRAFIQGERMRRCALFLLLSAHSCLAFVPALMVRPGLSCRGGRAVGGHGGRLGAAMRSITRTARAGMTSARMGTSIPSVDVSKTVEFVQSVLAVGDEMPDVKELEVRLGLAPAIVSCPSLSPSLSSPPPPIPLSQRVAPLLPPTPACEQAS